MDWNIRNNRLYLILLFVLCGIVPHTMLLLLRIPPTSDTWSPAEIYLYSDFFVYLWSPFWAAYLAYSRLQKQDTFSLLPALGIAVLIPTYLYWYPHEPVFALTWIIPLILIIESTAFLKELADSSSKVISGIAANRFLLRSFYFWSIEFIGVIYIICIALSRIPETYYVMVTPFVMIPIPGILIFEVFRYQNNNVPTVWTLTIMLLLVPLSLYLISIGPMEYFKEYHLSCMGFGYFLIFLLLIVYNFDHWIKKSS